MKKKILIIEDELDFLTLLSLTAKKYHFECDTDSIGTSCVQKARQNKPDLVLLDLNLPKISGLGIISELKKDPSLSEIPIIVFSAYNESFIVQEALNRGAKAFFCKTSPLSTLFNVMGDYIHPTA